MAAGPGMRYAIGVTSAHSNPSERPGHEVQHSLDPQQVMATRELFWQNVMREILTSLSMICALRPAARPARPAELPEGGGGAAAGAGGGPSPGGGDPSDSEDPGGGREAQGDTGDGEQGAEPAAASEVSRVDPERPSFDAQLFDGRLAVITRRGERIPIADVFPLFACGIDTPRERVLSLALECTVFQIRTPAGEVYTLPLHEMGSFQALTPELMRRLSQMARKRQEQETGEKGLQQPFGFAAFTSLARETPPPMTDPAGPGGEGG
jgi:hypothetical protein